MAKKVPKDRLFGLSHCKSCVHSAEHGDPCDHDIVVAIEKGIIDSERDIDWGR